MPRQPIGLSFDETMAGGFALGESDPAAGKGAGERTGTELAIHVRVLIADLDRFLAEPQHPGGLSGTIDFPPLGNGMASRSGVFNLFNPGEAPQLKLMVYELGFEHGGQSYYFGGRKEVRDDPGLDLWRDTTTLFARLHNGPDASGPVVGAGILSLGVGALVGLLRTVEVLNAPTLPERAAALARFGRFFLGELWDSYSPHLGRS